MWCNLNLIKFYYITLNLIQLDLINISNLINFQFNLIQFWLIKSILLNLIAFAID